MEMSTDKIFESQVPNKTSSTFEDHVGPYSFVVLFRNADFGSPFIADSWMSLGLDNLISLVSDNDSSRGV